MESRENSARFQETEGVSPFEEETGGKHWVVRWGLLLVAAVAIVLATLGLFWYSLGLYAVDLEPCLAPCDGVFDHVAWDRVLKRYITRKTVDGIELNSFNYEALSQAQDPDFTSYLSSLEHANLTHLGPLERKALFINAYNAFAVSLVLEKEIPPSVATGPLVWKRVVGKVAGVGYSLDSIYHGVLRGEFEETRVHGSLNSASVSSPDLSDEAFEGAQLDSQLDRQMRAWMADRLRGWDFLDENTFGASKIFGWYEEDFLKEAPSIQDYIVQWVDAETAEMIRAHPSYGTQPKYFGFDRNLNF